MLYSKKNLLIFCIFVYFLFPLTLLAEEKKVGEWKQYIWETNRWKDMGDYFVYYQGENYLMAPINQKVDSNIVNSRGIFDVKFTDSEWHFKSDWGEEIAGRFLLKRIGAGIYHGWAYFGNEQLSENLWILEK